MDPIGQRQTPPPSEPQGSNPASSDDWDTELTHWASSGPRDEYAHRQTAATRIRSAITNNAILLDLSFLRITSVYLPPMTHLTSLSLSDTHLTAPPDLSSCTQLKWLDLSRTPLTAPPDLSSCTQLQTLSLSDTHLTAPPDLSSCTQLQTLDLSNTPLTAPPDLSNCRQLQVLYLSRTRLTAPPNLSSCTQLEWLDLSNTPLTAPPNLSSCTQLKWLYLSNTPLTAPPGLSSCTQLKWLDLSRTPLTAPPNLSSCTQLQTLSLSDTHLTAPPDLSNCRQLQVLYLSNCRSLRELPESIITLPSSCLIDLTECPLSEGVLSRLETLLTDRRNQGLPAPQITHSMNQAPPTSRLSEKELIASLCTSAEKTTSFDLTQLDTNQKSALALWLNQLSMIREFQTASPERTALAGKVLEMLEYTQKNKEYAGRFYTEIDNASTDCGDRKALFLIYLDLDMQECKAIESNDPKVLQELLLKKAIVTKLASIAKLKVDLLPLVDRIEVYLAYLVKLKAVFDLPIAIESMLYYGISRVTSEDLVGAVHEINQMDPHDLLVQNPTWRKQIKSEAHAQFEEGTINDAEYLAALTEASREQFPLPPIQKRATFEEFRRASDECTTLEEITTLSFEALKQWQLLLGENPTDAQLTEHSALLDHLEEKAKTLIQAFDKKVSQFVGNPSQQKEHIKSLVKELSFAEDPKFASLPQIATFTKHLKALKLAYQAMLAPEPPPAPAPAPLPKVSFRAPDPKIEELKTSWNEQLTHIKLLPSQGESAQAKITALKESLEPTDRPTQALINTSSELRELRNQIVEALKNLKS